MWRNAEILHCLLLLSFVWNIDVLTLSVLFGLQVPICVAKTALSFSHDPELKGAPKDFVLPVRDVVVKAGAGAQRA
jgi:formate--tetrahydrofolate ligase